MADRRCPPTPLPASPGLGGRWSTATTRSASRSHGRPTRTSVPTSSKTTRSRVLRRRLPSQPGSTMTRLRAPTRPDHHRGTSPIRPQRTLIASRRCNGICARSTPLRPMPSQGEALPSWPAISTPALTSHTPICSRISMSLIAPTAFLGHRFLVLPPRTTMVTGPILPAPSRQPPTALALSGWRPTSRSPASRLATRLGSSSPRRWSARSCGLGPTKST